MKNEHAMHIHTMYIVQYIYMSWKDMNAIKLNDEALIDLIERYQVLLHSLPGALFLFEK